MYGGVNLTGYYQYHAYKLVCYFPRLLQFSCGRSSKQQFRRLTSVSAKFVHCNTRELIGFCVQVCVDRSPQVEERLLSALIHIDIWIRFACDHLAISYPLNCGLWVAESGTNKINRTI